MVKMRTKRIYCVVAYDVSLAKRRNKVIKIIEPYGRRINFSVYECMFTEAQLSAVKKKISEVVLEGVDQIAIYPICLSCYTKISYIPEQIRKFEKVHMFG